MKRWLIMAAGCMAGAAHAVDIPAVLQWSQRAELATPVGGVVQTVNVKVGDRIGKGEVLLRLDDRVYARRAEEAAAAVARHKAEAGEAARELKRVQELYDRTVISTSELDQAKLRRDRSHSALMEAQARLRQEQQHRADTALRAPFNALVVARQAEPGQAVAGGLQPQTLLVVAKADEMVARAMVPEGTLTGFKIGQAVTVVVERRDYPGKISILGLEPAARDRNAAPLYVLEAVFSPGGAVLRAGGAATLRLP